MSETHHVIAVTGLGDDRFINTQKAAIQAWRLSGLTPHLHRMDWANGHFEPKLKGLVEEAAELSETGDVSYHGFSAGGIAALIAYAQHPELVNKVFTTCSPIQHPEEIEEWRFEQNPAFEEAIAMLPESLNRLGANNRRRIVNWRPFKDGTVNPDNALLEGAYNRRFPMVDHRLSIFSVQLLGGHAMAKFIRGPLR